MIVATTYEQFKNLPKNKGKDSKTIYKKWLFEEQKLLNTAEAWRLYFEMQYNNFNLNVYGPDGSLTGASGQFIIPPTPPTSRVTYYTPNGSDGVTLGYYTPDLDDTITSYYIYI
jgi:hypothetical protein